MWKRKRLKNNRFHIPDINPVVVVVVVVVVAYPTPSEGWGHGGKPWSPKSRATLQGLDQRS